MTDEQLVRLCLENNREAQRRLFEKFSKRMMSLCIRYAGDEDNAKDIIQEGFIKVFQNLHQFTGKGSLSGWIKTIMIRTALRHLRNNKLVLDSQSAEEVDLAESSFFTETQLEAKELMEIIRQLPTGYRTIFNLYAIEGYTHMEIAEMLGISESTSKTQFIRAKSRISRMVLKLNEPVSA